MVHYDLFAGIGGFSLALEEVFYDEQIKHIFCEWEKFPTAVLKQHWPDGEYFGDIKDLIAHTQRQRLEGSGEETTGHGGQFSTELRDKEQIILTGGFPCQPFSHAGRRQGTADDRYQWPNMFEVIRNVRPQWVVAENVRGLVSWNEGMVLEQVCSDLESEGYEVQPIIIPAIAVNAPHRRDRVWIVAHAKDERPVTEMGLERESQPEATEQRSTDRDATDTEGIGNRGITSEERGAEERVMEPSERQGREVRSEGEGRLGVNWDQDWREVAFATCLPSMDDGLPRVMDGATISYAKWRNDSIKAYGNAIVPEVAEQIFKAMREAMYG